VVREPFVHGDAVVLRPRCDDVDRMTECVKSSKGVGEAWDRKGTWQDVAETMDRPSDICIQSSRRGPIAREDNGLTRMGAPSTVLEQVVRLNVISVTSAR